jgi:hypothetical protein
MSSIRLRCGCVDMFSGEIGDSCAVSRVMFGSTMGEIEMDDTPSTVEEPASLLSSAAFISVDALSPLDVCVCECSALVITGNTIDSSSCTLPASPSYCVCVCVCVCVCRG